MSDFKNNNKESSLCRVCEEGYMITSMERDKFHYKDFVLEYDWSCTECDCCGACQFPTKEESKRNREIINEFKGKVDSGEVIDDRPPLGEGLEIPWVSHWRDRKPEPNQSVFYVFLLDDSVGVFLGEFHGGDSYGGKSGFLNGDVDYWIDYEEAYNLILNFPEVVERAKHYHETPVALITKVLEISVSKQINIHNTSTSKQTS